MCCRSRNAIRLARACISENVADFAEKDALHPHLKADLGKRGLSPDQGKFFPSVEAFIDDAIKPSLAVLEAVKTAINEGTFELDLKSWLEEHFADLVSAKAWGPENFGLRREFESPTIESVQG